MSIFKKTLVAAAITGAFALTAPVMAASLTGPGTKGAPAQIVSYTVANGAVNAGVSAFDLTYAASDNLVGRTTGFGVRFTLPTGVKFTAAPTIAVSADIASATLASGGAGSSEVVFNVTPGAKGIGLDAVAGTAVTTKLTLSGVQISGATALATVGGTISATAVTFDPNTAATLNTATGTLLQGVNGLAVAYTPAAAGPKIDVGSSGNGNTNKVAKAVFSTTGSVNGTDVKYFDAGSVAITAAAGAINASSGATYALAAADRFNTTLTGNFAGFGGTSASVTLDTSCSAPTANAAPGVVSKDGSSVAFSAYDIAAPKPGAATFEVCFNADGKTALSASAVAASTTVTDGTSKVTSPADAGSLAAMVYNGSSVDVPVFNPGGNTAQQSFLRVSAAGQLGGLVTVKGVDDAGKASGTVTFNLGAGQSKQINSDDLSNGNTAKGLTGSLGTATGKWRLNVTGEFDKMVVQSLMRNNGSGTVTNLTGANVTN